VADAGFILDLAEETLREQGFVLAALTGSSVLGVRNLPPEAAAGLAARAEALLIAALLHETVSARDGADPRVHANVCVHVGDLARRAGDAQVSGGALVRTEAWAPRSDVLALCATTLAVEGITGFDVTAGPEYEGPEPSLPLVTVTRRS
jgi:hypothetical protein